MKETTKPSILLNLNCQLIYSIKSIYCITKNQQSKQKVVFLFFLLERKYFLLSDNPSRLSENRLMPERNSLESTPAPESFLSGRNYSHLGENTSSLG